MNILFRRLAMKDNTRLFAQNTLSSPELFDSLANELVVWHLSGHSGRGMSIATIQHLQNALIWLLSALYEAFYRGDGSTILPLGKSNFRGCKFGYRVTSSALKILAEGDLARIHVASPGVGESTATEIESTAGLRRRFRRIGFTWSNRSYDETREVIVLRQKDDFLNEKLTLPTPESPTIQKMRTQVHEINRMTLQWAVFPYVPDHILRRLICGGVNVQLNFSSMTYRRIFANGRIDHGGRFYGPWWQQLPKRLRPFIRINDEPTVELDFGGTALTLLYAAAGKQPPADPYDFSPEIAYCETNRSILKRYINALLNAPASYWLGRDEYSKLGVSRNRLLELVAQKHPAVKNAFGTQIGVQLQYSDSKIASRVMLELLAMNIPVLCIHDSFIVPQCSREQLRRTMFTVFREFTGVEPVIKQVPSAAQMIAGKYYIYDRFISSYARAATDGHPRSSSLVGPRKVSSNLEYGST